MDLEKEVITFLQENPYPPDSRVHDWAKQKGYDVHQVEEQIYKLATDYAKMQKEQG